MANVEAVLKKSDGSCQVFTHPAGPNDNCNLSVMQASLRKLQKETNDALTVLVDIEKSRLNNSSTKQAIDDGDDVDDDDDDEEDETDKKCSDEPEIKKPKSR